jgi:hypothetical protein
VYTIRTIKALNSNTTAPTHPATTSLFKATTFTKNPKNGGRPPKFNNCRAKARPPQTGKPLICPIENNPILFKVNTKLATINE